jgi:hypothetical protein
MPILGTLASQFSGKPFGSFESIATTTVGSGGSSFVEFTSIPNTYNHLQIRGIARSGRIDATYDIMTMRFNSDTGENYSHHFLFGDTSSANGGTNLSGFPSHIFALYYMSAIGSSADPIGLTNTFGGFVIDILDYKDSNKFTTTRTLGGQTQNGGTGHSGMSSGLWRNTNAITSIKLEAQTGSNIQQYSQFALYGIKGA